MTCPQRVLGPRTFTHVTSSRRVRRTRLTRDSPLRPPDRRYRRRPLPPSHLEPLCQRPSLRFHRVAVATKTPDAFGTDSCRLRSVADAFTAANRFRTETSDSINTRATRVWSSILKSLAVSRRIAFRSADVRLRGSPQRHQRPPDHSFDTQRTSLRKSSPRKKS